MRKRLLVLLLAAITVLYPASCIQEDFPDFKVLLQSELVPPEFDLTPFCVDNRAWSVGSAVIGCESDLYAPGDPIAGFLSATEAQIQAWVEDFYNGREFLDEPTTFLLLNCEEPIHVRAWSDYNDDPAFQDQLFEAMKLRVDIFRSYFPNAIIALGPSIRGQAEGSYLQIILDRIEALERAGEAGVFDACDCFEPRVFLGHGPADGPNWQVWNLRMTEQALDISSDLTNSFGLPLPLCVTSSFEIDNQDSNENGQPVAAAAAQEQLELILTYPNVLVVSWWAGSFEEAVQIPFLEDLDACSFIP